MVLTGTVAPTIAGGYEMYEVLQVGGVTVLEAIVLGLFAVLLAWIAFSFMSAIAGFALLLFRAGDILQIEMEGLLPALSSRNAMLLPTYNEDAHRIMARLRAIHESVAETGAGARFFYRHRADNTARQAGNIAEWVRRFGASYGHMIILDADSLMTGDTLVRLAAAIERYPGVALIQTLPIVVNAQTLFARLQQFAGRLYGPLIAAGIAWWHGSEGNYRGHNAIIRVQAFARDAGLPELRGRKPFGGHTSVTTLSRRR